MRSPLLDKHMKEGSWTTERVQFELESRFCIKIQYAYLKMVMSQNKHIPEYLARAIQCIVCPTIDIAKLFPESLTANSIGVTEAGIRNNRRSHNGTNIRKSRRRTLSTVQL